MLSVEDLVVLLLLQGDGKIDIFAPQVSTHAHAKFLSGRGFTKN